MISVDYANGRLSVEIEKPTVPRYAVLATFALVSFPLAGALSSLPGGC